MKAIFKHIISSLSGRIGLLLLTGLILTGILGPFLIPELPISSNSLEPFYPPGQGKNNYYLFGTDQIGRDVFRGVIEGARWALIIGCTAVFVSACIGILLGVLSGYFGDKNLKVGIFPLLLWFIVALLFSFYVTHLEFPFFIKVGLFLSFFPLSFYAISYLNRKWSYKKNVQINFPADFFVSRLIEIWRAVPALFILLAILSMTKQPSLVFIGCVIGVLSWTRVARLLRAEILKIRELEYIQAAKGLAYSHFRVIWHHILPNSIRPLLIVFAFSFASAVILEASISFLGIGNNTEIMTWGNMLNAARLNYRAWWLAVFPGMCICLLVMSLNLIADSLEKDMY